MRKYRGLTKDGRWYYGDLIHNFVFEPQGDFIPCAIIENNDWVEVIPETVGQSTGLCDKNGKKTKEACQGDLIKVKDGDGNAIGEVVKQEKKGQWYWQARKVDRSCLTIFIGRGIPLYEVLDNQYRWKGEIVGTIHENPDLLEAK